LTLSEGGPDDGRVSANGCCPHCGARLDPTLPDCPQCQRDAAEATFNEQKDPVARWRKWPVPWGLLCMLGLYFAAVLFYTRYEYFHSPAYRSSRHLLIVAKLLGDDDGLTSKKEELLEALDNLLAAIDIVPDDTWSQQQVEVLTRRLDERHVKIPQGMRQRLDSLGHRYRAIQDSRRSEFPVGARDIWDLDAPGNWAASVARRTTLGALVVFVFWLYKTLQDRKHRVSLELARQTERRKELRDLGGPKLR
jgi:hypothetical protein